jgi:glutathione S-transferase
MRLYDTQRSGNAWKVRLLAGLVGAGLARVTLSIDRGDLREQAFLARNPLGLVPVLELEDGRTIAESLAILHHLAVGTPFWPTAAFEQAQVLTWLSFEQAQHMHPLAQLRLRLALHRDRRADDGDMVAFRTQALEALALLDRQLARQGRDGWVATPDRPSIADVALYPYSRLAPMGGIDVEGFPHLAAWLARVEKLPGYQPLFPGRPDLNFATAELREL